MTGEALFETRQRGDPERFEVLSGVAIVPMAHRRPDHSDRASRLALDGVFARAEDGSIADFVRIDDLSAADVAEIVTRVHNYALRMLQRRGLLPNEGQVADHTVSEAVRSAVVPRSVPTQAAPR